MSKAPKIAEKEKPAKKHAEEKTAKPKSALNKLLVVKAKDIAKKSAAADAKPDVPWKELPEKSVLTIAVKGDRRQMGVSLMTLAVADFLRERFPDVPVHYGTNLKLDDARLNVVNGEAPFTEPFTAELIGQINVLDCESEGTLMLHRQPTKTDTRPVDVDIRTSFNRWYELKIPKISAVVQDPEPESTPKLREFVGKLETVVNQIFPKAPDYADVISHLQDRQIPMSLEQLPPAVPFRAAGAALIPPMSA